MGPGGRQHPFRMGADGGPRLLDQAISRDRLKGEPIETVVEHGVRGRRVDGETAVAGGVNGAAGTRAT
jgi:hypothetical protein